MKKPIKYWLCLLSIFCILTSCDKEYPACANSTDNTQDRISQLIYTMYDKVHQGSRASGIKICDIDTKKYSVNDSLATRSTGEEQTYDIHTVTIDFGETSGYAILSDTPGIDQVFFYTENGCIEDTTSIEPLKDLIDYIPTLAEGIMTHSLERVPTKTRAELNIQPLVKYEWGQEVPFNNYATYCTCSKCKERGNHMLIGCVTVAVGQFIATMKKFTGTFYGNRNIDFESFPARSWDFSKEQSLYVAHFLQEVALNCQTKFGCDRSSSTVLSAAHYLLDLGYAVDNVKGYINKDRFIRNLMNGVPHIAYGKSKKATATCGLSMVLRM